MDISDDQGYHPTVTSLVHNVPVLTRDRVLLKSRRVPIAR